MIFQTFKSFIDDERGGVEFIESSLIISFILFIISLLIVISFKTNEKIYWGERVYYRTNKSMNLDDAKFITSLGVSYKLEDDLFGSKIVVYFKDEKLSLYRMNLSQTIRRVDFLKFLMGQLGKLEIGGKNLASRFDSYKKTWDKILEKLP